MRRSSWGACAAAAVLAAATLIPSGSAQAAPAAGSAGTHSTRGPAARLIGHATLVNGAGTGELRPPSGDDLTITANRVANGSNRSIARHTTTTLTGITGTSLRTTGAAGATSLLGITQYDQRTADGGNQFTLTPPDQALCAAPNGQVVESVNNAIAVYSGDARQSLMSMNRFLFDDSEFNRTTGVASPHQVGDPSCIYDPGTGRFFLTVYDLTSDSAGSPTGPSAVDIAMSPVGTALGTWSVFSIDTSHTDAPAAFQCPCFSDYPHLATNREGLFITSNEFSTLGSAFNGAQVFAIAKQDLIAKAGLAGTQSVASTRLSTGFDGDAASNRGFTLAPAKSASVASYPASGTMYFLSSDAAFEASGRSTAVRTWTLTGTKTLGTASPDLTLTYADAAVPAYAVPPASTQKPGPFPLGECLNVTACAKSVLGTPNRFKEREIAFDSGDTRMLQTAYSGGKLWGALDTAVDVGGTVRAGVAYYVLTPGAPAPVKTATLVVPGNDISYPALAVTDAGRAVMGVTLTGDDHYPSAAYVSLNSTVTPTSVAVSAEGKTPDDDFSGYRAFLYNRPRWGDYGAATVVGNQVLVASEYIESSCTLATFQADTTCGGTRTLLANWATRVTTVTP